MMRRNCADSVKPLGMDVQGFQYSRVTGAARYKRGASHKGIALGHCPGHCPLGRPTLRSALPPVRAGSLRSTSGKV